jgi:urate oxidase
MGIALGPHRYGKAETRLVRVSRDGADHTLVDLNVSVALSGEPHSGEPVAGEPVAGQPVTGNPLAGGLAAAHLTGDNAAVLPTDSQKNTVYAFARRHGVAGPEPFGLLLARHFVAGQPAVHRAEVRVEAYGWERLGPHSFRRDGRETRTATVTHDAATGTAVEAGLTGLVLLNTTGSEFRGFARDPYTTLPEAADRVLATAVDASWRLAGVDVDWDASYAGVRDALVAAFVDTYSRSLQQTLFAMGERALLARPELTEISLSLPNRHHLLVDLAPFGLDNPDEVYVAADRPYGLIEATVVREG